MSKSLLGENMIRNFIKLFFLLIIILSAINLYPGKADVIKVRFKETGDRVYRFWVTLRHNDTGWKHYADRWEILTPDRKKILATRVLVHPHVDEQPFTRSMANIKIPSEISKVIVRAHDKVHGYGGKEVTVNLDE